MGIVDTRTSTTLPAIFLVMRPSWQPLFCDVEAGFDLHATHDRSQEPAIRLLARNEPSVDSIPHDDFILGWLDVNIGRTLFDRSVEQIVDPANDRRFIGHVDQVTELLDFLAFFRLGECGFVLALVDPVDGVVDRFFGCCHRSDRLLEKNAQVVDGERI